MTSTLKNVATTSQAIPDPAAGNGNTPPPPTPEHWLREQRGHSGQQLRLAVALGLAGGLVIIAQAWLLARIINAVVIEHAGLDDVAPWLWSLPALFLLRALLSHAAEQAGFRAALAVKLAVRDQAWRKLQALGPVPLSGERSGDLGTMLVDGIEALEDYYARYLPAMSLMVLVPLAMLAFVWPQDSLSGFIMLVTAPLIPFFMVLIGKGAERRNQRQWRQLARMSAYFLDVIQGLTTLKLFNASRREASAIARISDSYRESTMSVLRIAFLSSFALEFLATLSIAVVAVLIGFRLLWGEMAFFNGFLVLLLAPEFYLPLRNMGTHYHARMQAIGAAERLVEVLETPAPAPPPAAAPQATPQQSRQGDRIRLQQVSYRYPGGRRALQDLSFSVQAGERVALVGPSGAGKSTVVNLLLGFIQADSGELLLDGRSLSVGDVRSRQGQVAWVPQRPRLFHGTVMDNIRLGNPQASRQQAEDAAADAYAADFIARLPQGYDTVVGEQGQGLSGGQIQRLALARALLSRAPLVILDEATANLDLASEQQVQAAIDRLAGQRTLLLVAHRLTTVQRADRILVMDQGRVVETGTHRQLAQAGGPYQRLLADYRQRGHLATPPDQQTGEQSP